LERVKPIDSMPSWSYNVLENSVLVSLIKFFFYIKRENGTCISLDHKRNGVFRRTASVQ